MLNEAACDLSEFEVSCYIGRNEDVGEFAVGHQELGYEVDVPIVDPAILLPRLLSFLEVAILLVELAQLSDEGAKCECNGHGHTDSMLTEAASLWQYQPEHMAVW